MALIDILPQSRNFEMPQRIWETYEVLVGLCNTLNALSGSMKTSNPFASNVMLKSQGVITELLLETGRLQEFEEWEKQRDVEPDSLLKYGC